MSIEELETHNKNINFLINYYIHSREEFINYDYSFDLIIILQELIDLMQTLN